MEDFRKTALVAAKEAGKILMDNYREEKVIRFKENNSPVTDIDISSQEKIVEILKEKYPDHSFLGEENLGIFTESPYMWIIDPIDGTKNYIKENDGFSISIALAKSDEIILGIVYAPALDKLFIGEKGKEATLNGEKIVPGNESELSKVYITSVSCSEKEKDDRSRKKRFYYNITKNIPNIICFKTGKNKDKLGFEHGSVALELCYVACNKLDGVARIGISAWDFAAGVLIAKEAGVKITNSEGKDISIEDDSIICANPALHEKMMKVLK